jgi:hypothetical protein
VAQARTLIGDIRWLGGTKLLTVHRIGRFGVFLLKPLLSRIFTRDLILEVILLNP